jgi:hypothetical protein
MKTHSLLRLCAALVFPSLCASPLAAQEDDFNDANDAGWTRFAPLSAAGGTLFTNTAGAYQFSCQPSPDPANFGPSRAGSLRQDHSYGNFCVMVDIVSWNPAEDSSLGILARIQPNPGAGNVNGYSFTWQAQDNDVQISRITGEQPADLSGNPKITLTPGEGYRMVFTGIEDRLEGRIYSLDDLSAPLISVTATDSNYAAGTCGLVVFSDSNTRASAGFDNYFANDGTPPPVTITQGENGDILVSWDSKKGLGARLESSFDMQDGTWFPVFGYTAANGTTTYADPSVLELDSLFYRLRTGRQP